jgi:L-lactate dehydrogenase complex protein LldG
MSARDHILQRLRAAPQGQPPLPPTCPAFMPRSRRPAGQHACRTNRPVLRQDGFLARRSRPRQPGELAERTAPAVRGEGRPFLLHGEQYSEVLTAAGIAGLKPYDRPIEEWKSELFENTDASLTSTRGGIAETGTLIVWPDASEPRLMSLVPPIHFALLDADQLYDNLFAAMSAQSWSGNLPSNALLVSGPSKTADIQVTLAYGAHGPKELVVLLLVDERD